MSLVLIVLCSWFVIALFAVILCMAARRTDREISGADLAPVIDIHAASLAGRKHVA